MIQTGCLKTIPDRTSGSETHNLYLFYKNPREHLMEDMRAKLNTEKSTEKKGKQELNLL
ncbi:Mobile element protein [Methanosarcina siciliae T4/M]|uniref:Mobile element protein n=1 Tax=Methanosarcina siciliae T4/M TaxID=1434120 RepID=A0A0E3P5A3_9EURY|nr:Mobile element protein [Methanosarcina siciliae T4/M]